MMNRSKSSDMQVFKYLLAVPAVTGLLLLTDLSQAKDMQEPLTVRANEALSNASLNDFLQAAVKEYNEGTDTGRPAPPAPPAPPVPAGLPPVPPAPPQPGNNITAEPIDPNRITTIDVTEEIVNGNTITKSTRIASQNIKYLTINTDPDNKQNTKVHSNAMSTSFKKGDYTIYLDGERFYESLTELNPKAIKSLSILSGKHAVDFDPKLSMDDKIIVIETNKEIKENPSPVAPPFQVFPNPTAAYWTIKTGQQSANDSYELFDRDGNKKASGKLEQSTRINGTAFPEGVYFLKLYIGGKSYQARLEKQIN